MNWKRGNGEKTVLEAQAGDWMSREITYKDIMFSDLRNLNNWKFAVSQITEELATINAEVTAIKATNYDKMPGGNGENTQEEKLVSAIAKKAQKEAELELNNSRVADIERILAQLDETERQIIERMVINKGKFNLDALCEELGYEKTHVYRIRDGALMKLCKLRFGAAYRP